MTQVTFESRFHGQPLTDTIGRPMLGTPTLDADESLLAGDITSHRPGRRHSAVTDRRIIIAWRTATPERPRAWAYDSVWFQEVTAWRQGRAHDERPVIVVEHPAHERLEHVPAHRVLWFEWGNSLASVAHTSTQLRFPSRRDPAFLAVLEGLLGTGAPEGEPFEERPPGTRQERLAGNGRMLTRRVIGRERWYRR